MSGGAHIKSIVEAIRSLAEVDPSELSDDELAEGCLASTTLVNVALAHAASLLAEFQVRGTWVEDGAGSAAAWVANRTGERRGELAGRAKVGLWLRQLPATEAAAAAGEITFDHARRVVDCFRRHPVLAVRDEAVLLAQAKALDADAFRMAARHWVALADDTLDADERAASAEPARCSSLHLSQMPDGWYRLDGDLSPDDGAQLTAVLDAHVDRALREQRDGDPSLAQMPVSALRADGLADVIAHYQRRKPSENSVPDRYRVAVVIPPGQRGDLPLACCDSPTFRAVLNARSEVLDIGRTTNAWPSATRRAVTLRDGGCVFPGCDRPPSWCDIHHCDPWDHGGHTDLDNAAMVCRRHHTFIHAKHWRIVITKPRGKPQVHRPDGTIYTIENWQLDKLPA